MMMTNELNDGGPAYPSQQGYVPEHGWNQTWDPGMSKRQFYKSVAMGHMIQAEYRRNSQQIDYSFIATASAGFADALLAEDAEFAKRQEKADAT